MHLTVRAVSGSKLQNLASDQPYHHFSTTDTQMLSQAKNHKDRILAFNL